MADITPARQKKPGYRRIHADTGFVRIAGMTPLLWALVLFAQEAERVRALELKTQGEQQFKQDKLAEAARITLQSLKISESIHDRPAIGDAANRISYFHYLMGNLAESKRYAERAYAMRKELGDEKGIAGSLNNLGDLAMRMGEVDRALEYLPGAIAGFTRLGDVRLRALATGNLGIVSMYLGDPVRALELVKEALDLCRSINNESGMALAYSRLGQVYRNQGRHGLELDSYQRSLDLRRKLGDKWAVAVALNNLGLAHHVLGNPEQAERLYREGLALNREVGNMGLLSTTLQNLGALAVERGRPADGVLHLEQSIAIARANHQGMEENEAQLTAAGALRKLKRFDEAETHLHQVAARSYLPERALAQTTLAAIAYDRRNYAEAARMAQQAVDLSREIDTLDVEWYAHTIRGKALLAGRQTAAAGESFDRAIEVIERLRTMAGGDEGDRERFFADKLDPYYEAIAIAFRENQAGKALQYAERGKARVLFEAVRSSRSAAMDRLPPGTQRRERELRARLVTLNGRIRKEGVSRALESERAAVRKEHEALRAAALAGFTIPGSDSQSGITLAAARKLAGPDRVVLEYVTMADRTLVFAITAQAVRGYWLHPPSQRIQAMSRELRNLTASRDLRTAESALALYQVLIAPVEALVHGKAEVVVIPDTFLWEVPFQALRSPAGRWLIQDAAISYAPSLAFLAAARVQPRPRRTEANLLAFANPRTESGDLPPLPMAEEQVTRIAQLYGPDRSHVRTGPSAGEAAFKAEAPSHSVLHIAAHGVLDEGSAMYSHLVLSHAPKDPEDGLLEAWEIMSMKLRSDLVVLSACETARGRVSKGEGVIGLAWAFQVAGAPSLIVSQWKVESASTMEAMVAFHRAWTTSGYRSKASALRAASLQVLRNPDYSHPFYWGGHILVGRSD